MGHECTEADTTNHTFSAKVSKMCLHDTSPFSNLLRLPERLINTNGNDTQSKILQILLACPHTLHLQNYKICKVSLIQNVPPLLQKFYEHP